MKTHTLGVGQFVEFIVPVKGMKHEYLYVRSSHNVHVSPSLLLQALLNILYEEGKYVIKMKIGLS